MARDPVVLALGSAGCGAATGGALMTVGVITLRALQVQRGGLAQQDADFAVLSASVLTGIAAAAALGWRLSRGIEDFWRRGVTAALAAFGACVLAVAAAPAHALGGRVGLLVYGGLLALTGVWSFGRARRAA